MTSKQGGGVLSSFHYVIPFMGGRSQTVFHMYALVPVLRKKVSSILAVQLCPESNWKTLEEWELSCRTGKREFLGLKEN